MRGVVLVSPQEKAGNAVGWGPSCQPGERAFGLHTPNRRVQAADLRWRQQPDWAAPGDVSDGVLGLPRGVFPCGTNRKHLARTQHSNKTLAWQARHARRGATWLGSGASACVIYVPRTGRGSLPHHAVPPMIQHLSNRRPIPWRARGGRAGRPVNTV